VSPTAQGITSKFQSGTTARITKIQNGKITRLQYFVYNAADNVIYWRFRRVVGVKL
jgi:hypothetical protein